MSFLLILISAMLIFFLMKCIYNSITIQDYQKIEEPPSLEDTLLLILNPFKKHILEVYVHPDSVVVYCFKHSPSDGVADCNEFRLRFCDLDFKSIPNDECASLQDRLKTSLGMDINGDKI